MSLSRRARLGLLGTTTAALALVAWYAVHSMMELRKIRTQAAVHRVELSQLKALLPVIQQREAYAREAQALQEQVKRLGLSPTEWTNRRVQKPVTVVSRSEAEKLVAQQLGRSGRDWFVAERFDVSVVNQADGLFTAAQPADKGFNLEMIGNVYFPVAVK